jgi:hypothetical protein
VVAHGDGQRLLGVFLADDEAVEVRLDVLGLQVEIEFDALALPSSLGGVVSARSGCAANTTRSPNSCFMNSESFFWISSGDGNG